MPFALGPVPVPVGAWYRDSGDPPATVLVQLLIGDTSDFGVVAAADSASVVRFVPAMALMPSSAPDLDVGRICLLFRDGVSHRSAGRGWVHYRAGGRSGGGAGSVRLSGEGPPPEWNVAELSRFFEFQTLRGRNKAVMASAYQSDPLLLYVPAVREAARLHLQMSAAASADDVAAAACMVCRSAGHRGIRTGNVGLSMSADRLLSIADAVTEAADRVVLLAETSEQPSHLWTRTLARRWHADPRVRRDAVSDLVAALGELRPERGKVIDVKGRIERARKNPTRLLVAAHVVTFPDEAIDGPVGSWPERLEEWMSKPAFSLRIGLFAGHRGRSYLDVGAQ